MRGPIPPLPQYTFMAWCLVKRRDDFTISFTRRRNLENHNPSLDHRENFKSRSEQLNSQVMKYFPVCHMMPTCALTLMADTNIYKIIYFLNFKQILSNKVRYVD